MIGAIPECFAIIGGSDRLAKGRSDRKVEIWSEDADSFLLPIDTPVSFGGAAKLPSGQVLVCGADAENAQESLLWSYPGAEMRPGPKLPTPLHEPFPIVLGQDVFVLGYEDDEERYPTPAMLFKAAGPGMAMTLVSENFVKSDLAMLTATAHEGAIYVFTHGEMRKFDPFAGAWLSCARPPFELPSQGGLASFGGRLVLHAVVPGGGAAQALDPREGSWTSLARFAVDRTSPALRTLNGRLWAVGDDALDNPGVFWAGNNTKRSTLEAWEERMDRWVLHPKALRHYFTPNFALVAL